MPGVYKTPAERKAKGSRWRVWYRDAGGKRRWKTAFTDRAESLRLAHTLEDEARRVREGLVDPLERSRRQASLRAVADHLEDWRRGMLAQGCTKKHARGFSEAARRLLYDASVANVTDIAPDRIAVALERLGVIRSARTRNHALAAVRAFARWLEQNHRIREAPRGLFALRPVPESSDRKRVRRELSRAELDRLYAAAESGPPVAARWEKKSRHLATNIDGPTRALLYRLAAGTGFREQECATLTPEAFRLEGPAPAVVVRAAYSKRGKRSGRDDVQPITRALAAALVPFLEGKPPGKPVFVFPARAAEMLAADLERAGIPYRDAAGRVADFHALRHSYISDLVRRKVSVKVAQTLARHSTPSLTIGLYSHADDPELRSALEDTDE